MKNILIVCVFLSSINVFGQRLFIDVQHEIGVSSFTKSILPFDYKFSDQTTISVGSVLSDHLSLRLGLGHQQSGARSQLLFTDNSGNIVESIEKYDLNFIKIPIDAIFYLGENKLFRMDIGSYLNINANSKKKEVKSSNPIISNDEPLHKNDVGIRIRPSFSIPINDKSEFSIGILGEFGLVELLLPNTFNYNIYLSGSLHYRL